MISGLHKDNVLGPNIKVGIELRKRGVLYQRRRTTEDARERRWDFQLRVGRVGEVYGREERQGLWVLLMDCINPRLGAVDEVFALCGIGDRLDSTDYQIAIEHSIVLAK